MPYSQFGFKEMDVYRLSYQLALDLFHITKKFPRD